ncbi:DUF3179 domain-containing (seleno)protein [Phytoactinopolyspora endophytica]|uniref:DUF3179 domain-containing (seleno)protein n=1 Tax=Phytoactinopolyspora endophytica TaxID=1642495 RepID=UPI003B8322F7
MEDAEAVLSVTIEGETRGYPVQVLMWHEIVNDTIPMCRSQRRTVPCATPASPSTGASATASSTSAPRAGCTPATWSCTTGRPSRYGRS